MMSRFDNSNEDAYAFVGGFLNCGYMAGYVRNLDFVNANSEVPAVDTTKYTPEQIEKMHEDYLKGSFFLQQTNNVNLSLPCLIKDAGYPVPKDNPELDFPPSKTVRGHFTGRRLPSGERIADFRIFRVSDPDFRDMPMELPSTRDSVEGAPKEFRKQLFNISKDEAFEKKAVVQCLNHVRVSGFLEAWAYARNKHGERQSDCIVIALRQTADASESIPLRMYGKANLPHYVKYLQTGIPLFVEGSYRVKVIPLGIKDENGVEKVMKLPYIHCSNIKKASLGEHIKASPSWWYEMRDRLLSERKARAAAAADMAKQAGDEVLDDSSKHDDTSSKKNPPPAVPPVEEDDDF